MTEGRTTEYAGEEDPLDRLMRACGLEDRSEAWDRKVEEFRTHFDKFYKTWKGDDLRDEPITFGGAAEILKMLADEFIKQKSEAFK